MSLEMAPFNRTCTSFY